MKKKTIVWIIIILIVGYLIILFTTADSPFDFYKHFDKPRKGVVHDPDQGLRRVGDRTVPESLIAKDKPRLKSRRIGEYFVVWSKKYTYINASGEKLERGMKVCYVLNEATEIVTVIKIKEEDKKCDE